MRRKKISHILDENKTAKMGERKVTNDPKFPERFLKVRARKQMKEEGIRRRRK